MNDAQFKRVVGKGNPFSLSIFPKPKTKHYQNKTIEEGEEITPTSFRQREKKYIHSQYGYYSPMYVLIEPLKKRGYCFYDFIKNLLYTISRTFRHMQIIKRLATKCKQNPQYLSLPKRGGHRR